MESIRKILIDLSINKNMVEFLSLVKQEVSFTMDNVYSMYTSSNTIQEDVENDIGHSNTFLDIIERTRSTFSSLQEADNYLSVQTVNLNPYHTFKPIINRSVNYNNEPQLFETVKNECAAIFLSYRQYMHYYSSIFYGSSITQYNQDETYTISPNEDESIQNHFKGIINFMSLDEKRLLYKGFAINLLLCQKLFFHFSHLYNKLTRKNENLDEIRAHHKALYLSLEQLVNTMQMAKLELEKLLSEEIQEFIIRNPFRADFFKQSIQDICSTLVVVQSEMNDLLAALDIPMIIEEDTTVPDTPTVYFVPEYFKVSVEIPSNASTFEYSLDEGEFFITGSNYDSFFYLEENTTYTTGQIQVRARDNNHNVSEIISNTSSFNTPDNS